jgi:hypothetical protein
VARFCVQFFRTLIEIMPQITAEKKFFQDKTDKFLQNTALKLDKTIAVTEFQELQKNIAGGEE